MTNIHDKSDRLADLILEECIFFKINNKSMVNHKAPIDEILNWCEFHFGSKRLLHPIFESDNHQLGFFDGKWAVTFGYLGQDSFLFWFANVNDRMNFALTWM
jgi:hypothetical protein